MEASVQCKICLNDYHEETCIPKFLDCGHSICDKCLASILQTQKSCPECRATLTRSIGEYTTNFSLLSVTITLKEKSHAEFLDALTLDFMMKELKSKMKTTEKLMVQRERITCSLITNKTYIQKLLSYTRKLFEADQIEDLVLEVKDLLEKVDESLNFSWERDKDLIRLKDFQNKQQFLDVIALRCQEGRYIYACKRVSDLGVWRYGKVTFAENLLRIHCLSFSEFEPNASLILLDDVKDCISRGVNLVPFVEIGNQKLHFTLTDDSSIDTLRFLKFCTGEDGHTIKGLDSEVGRHYSGDLNKCFIKRPISMFQSYENCFVPRKYEAKKGEVILERFYESFVIMKWTEDKTIDSLIAKLQPDCQIDFNIMQSQKKITDCGISLRF